MIYALDPDRREEIVRRSLDAIADVDGIDLAMWLDSDEAVIRGHRGELRFAPGGELQDLRGQRWSVDGDLGALRAEIQDGRLLCTEYPDPLGRVWSALRCPNAGDILLSAAPGLRVRGLGRVGPRRRRLARILAPLRLAGDAAVVRHRPDQSRGP